jgi:hypothetical protein
VYGDANPRLAVKYSGAINNWQTLSNRLKGPASSVSKLTPVGVYEISVEGPTNFENHAVSYSKGQFRVTPAPLLITPEAITITNGDPVPHFIFKYSGWVNGEDERVLTQMPQVTNAVPNLPSGGRYQFQACCASCANYNISYGPGWIRVDAAQPSRSDPLQALADWDADLERLLRRFRLWETDFPGFSGETYSLLENKAERVKGPKGPIPRLDKDDYLRKLDVLRKRYRKTDLESPFKQISNKTRDQFINELESAIKGWRTSD